MALFDPATGEVNATAYGLDAHAALDKQPSIFESVTNVVTKGIPLTTLSIINSFANTGVDLINLLGGDVTRFKVADQLSALGDDGTYGDYYKSHEQGIEGAGFIAGSLIPGLAAIKALKLMQAGKLGEVMQKATGLFSGPKDAIIAAAKKELSSPDNIFGLLGAAKTKAIALGMADNALQGLVFEVAVTGTMKASPMLDEANYKDVLSNMFFGAVLGGVFGGAIEGIFINKEFNKMLLESSKATKPSELTTRFGFPEGAKLRGVSTAGDEVAILLDSLDKIPIADPNSLVGKVADLTKNNAVLDAKLKLHAYIGPGEEELTNGLFDTLMAIRASGGSKEDTFNFLAGLAKVSRIDTPPSIPTGEVFYVNSFSRDKAFSLADVTSVTPHANSDLSRAYQLRPFAGKPIISTAEDTFQDVLSGMNFIKYAKSSEVWAEGADIFIDKNKRVFVNPNAPNIEGRIARPGESRVLSLKEEAILGARRDLGARLPADSTKILTGAPVILNMVENKIVSSAVPVVGDYGAPTLFNKGLLFGKKTSIQSIESELTTASSTLDSNARYVWAEQRGLVRGDTISSTDIPMLETLYRKATAAGETFKDFIDNLAKRYISFSGDLADNLPASAKDLALHIQNTKNDFINELQAAHPIMSSRELSLRANVTEDYLAGSLSSTETKQFMIDPTQYMKANHVQLEYDIGNISMKNGQIMRGLIDSQMRIQIIQDAAENAMARKFGKDWELFVAKGKSAAESDIQGVSAGFMYYVNSNYSSIGNAMERIGRIVSKTIRAAVDEDARSLQGVMNAIRADNEAAAELGIFIHVRRMTGEKYVFLPDHLAVEMKMGSNTVVLQKSLIKGKAGNIVKWDKDYIPAGFSHGIENDALHTVSKAGPKSFYMLSDKVAAFEQAQMAINDARIIDWNNWRSSMGLSNTRETGTLYAPPINTANYPHFALVKPKEGMAFADDGVSMIVGETAAELEQKAASLTGDFEVFYKSTTAKYKKVEGEYNYQRNFGETRVDSELLRRGVLNNVYPDVRAESILPQYVDFNSRQTTRLIRDYVELGNGQLFAELRAMGARFADAETSKVGFVNKAFGRTVNNPYESYVKTALDIGPGSEYTMWYDAAEKAEAFASSVYRKAVDSFDSAKRGMISFEDVTPILEKMGLGSSMAAATNKLSAYNNIANRLPPSRILSKIVATVNSIQTATAIRLDVWQTAINIISTPIMLMAEAKSAGDLLRTILPDGSGVTIPSTTKVIFRALNNTFDAAIKKEWFPQYIKQGIISEDVNVYSGMLDNLAMPFGNFSESAIVTNLKNAVDVASKFTGATWAEQYVRLLAAESAREIFQRAGQTGQQLLDNIGTFVNRVHGNHVASQRPVAFQGPIGQAAGLFQSYQLNFLQQMFRYVENGEGKTLALMAGLQTGIFGTQSLPGVQMINQHLIGGAAGNPAHKDMYSSTVNFFDKTLGDYLLYGAASNVLQTGLYSRGDVNPRQITILPIYPWDYPAISGGINFISNLIKTTDKIIQGGSLTESMLQGLEHNGLSRPLSGLAQLMKGSVTNQAGNLVTSLRPSITSDSLGWGDLFSAANFSRLLGARPLDEAIQTDALYRKSVYVAQDATRIQRLGEAIKSEIASGGSISPESINNFARAYTNAGGAPDAFAGSIMRWTMDATVAQGNQILMHMKLPVNQQLMMHMGGIRMKDTAFYTGGGNTSSAPSGPLMPPPP